MAGFVSRCDVAPVEPINAAPQTTTEYEEEKGTTTVMNHHAVYELAKLRHADLLAEAQAAHLRQEVMQRKVQSGVTALRRSIASTLRRVANHVEPTPVQPITLPRQRRASSQVRHHSITAR